jgi:ethanolamine kinase
MIDRDLETATYCALAEAGVLPEYHGRFGNGRIEGWISDAVPLTLDQMSHPEVSTKIARKTR